MVQPGDDLAALLGDAIESARVGVKPHDVVVVCQKVVSKAEGAVVDLEGRGARRRSPSSSPHARRWERTRARTRSCCARRPASYAWIAATSSSRHVTAGCAPTRASTSRTGSRPGVLTLLPRDPDASAEGLRSRLAERFGVELAVVITDTFGRPWREGLVEVAIGVRRDGPAARSARAAAICTARSSTTRWSRSPTRWPRLPAWSWRRTAESRPRSCAAFATRPGRRAPRLVLRASPSSTSSGDRRPGRGALSPHPGVA